MITQIKARGSHLRGQFKTKARNAVASTFGFELSTSLIVKESNRTLLIELKTQSAYMYQVYLFTLRCDLPDGRCDLQQFHPPLSGLYKNRAVQQIINEVLFKNKTAEGVKWPEYYQPIPIPAYALALTAVSD